MKKARRTGAEISNDEFQLSKYRFTAMSSLGDKSWLNHHRSSRRPSSTSSGILHDRIPSSSTFDAKTRSVLRSWTTNWNLLSGPCRSPDGATIVPRRQRSLLRMPLTTRRKRVIMPLMVNDSGLLSSCPAVGTREEKDLFCSAGTV